MKADVKIELDGTTGHIWIDGKEVKNCTAFKVECDYNDSRLPRVHLDLIVTNAVLRLKETETEITAHAVSTGRGLDA